MTRSRPIRTVAVLLTIETALTNAQLRKLTGVVVADATTGRARTIPRGKARGGPITDLGTIRGVSVDVIPPTPSVLPTAPEAPAQEDGA